MKGTEISITATSTIKANKDILFVILWIYLQCVAQIGENTLSSYGFFCVSDII